MTEPVVLEAKVLADQRLEERPVRVERALETERGLEVPGAHVAAEAELALDPRVVDLDGLRSGRMGS